MKTLVYKRTHIGDPDDKGWFGIRDCMGRVRGYGFDAVIGVGGKALRSGRNVIENSSRNRLLGIKVAK